MQKNDITKTCFVISPFGDPYDMYFASITRPAIESCGLLAVRGDSLYRPSTIVEDIWQGIQDSIILVAELTGRNPNVFYELGLAHALSKPVVLVAESIDDVPFDLRAIRVLLYNKNDPKWGQKLEQGLKRAIKEVLDNPSSSVPTPFKNIIHIDKPEESEAIARIESLEATVRSLIESINAGNRTTITSQAWNQLEETSSTTTIPTLAIGDHVLHKQFGKGKVLGIELVRKGQVAKINFENHGVKNISQQHAKMQLLSSEEA